MNVKTNNTPRPLIYWEDLTSKEQRDVTKVEGLTFFRYKGHIYSVEDFTSCVGEPASDGWDGYTHHTAFSGVVIYLVNDYSSVVVGSYTI